MKFVIVAREEETFLKALLDLIKEERFSGNITKTHYSGNPIDGYIGYISSQKKIK